MSVATKSSNDPGPNLKGKRKKEERIFGSPETFVHQTFDRLLVSLYKPEKGQKRAKKAPSWQAHKPSLDFCKVTSSTPGGGLIFNKSNYETSEEESSIYFRRLTFPLSEGSQGQTSHKGFVKTLMCQRSQLSSEMGGSSVARALGQVIPQAQLASHNVLALGSEDVNLGAIPIRSVALRSAAEQLLGLWDGVQAVEFNRLACLRLVERSATIFHVVLQEAREDGEAVLDQPIDNLLGTLKQIANLLPTLAHRPFLKRYIQRKETLREIQRCDHLLTDSVAILSLSLQLRVLQSIQLVRLDEEEHKQIQTNPIPRLEDDAKDPDYHSQLAGLPQLDAQQNTMSPMKGSDNSVVFHAIVQMNAVENKLDSVRDAADLRAVINRALTQNNDVEMLRILQLDRKELPEAMKILQRAVDDAEVPPAYSPGAGPPEYAASDEADQKLIMGVIDALRRVSDGAYERGSPGESIASIMSLPEPEGPASSRSSLLSNQSMDSALSSPLPDPYDTGNSIAEKRNERMYRLLFVEHDFHPALNLPLWNPIFVPVGAVGFLDRTSGLFVTLFDSLHPDLDRAADAKAIPSMVKYEHAVTIGTQEHTQRTAVQRGFDMLAGIVTLMKSDTEDFPSISHTYSHPLRKASYLMADTATYKYIEDLRAPKAWFKDNVDLIISEYG
ncbi:hypothetical protein B0H12DRAFT_1308070, partial [Mycena haematopus]